MADDRLHDIMAQGDSSDTSRCRLLGLPPELLTYIVSLASSSDMCTSPPVSNVIPEEHDLSVNRQIRRLTIENWYDTHWYGAYGKLEHYGFELYTYFAFTNTFYREGRNILMPVDVYKGAQEMNRLEAMERLRYYLSFYQALRRLVVVLVPQKWCPDNGLVEELMVMIENALALYAQERVASRGRFRYKVKLYKKEA